MPCPNVYVDPMCAVSLVCSPYRRGVFEDAMELFDTPVEAQVSVIYARAPAAATVSVALGDDTAYESCDSAEQ